MSPATGERLSVDDAQILRLESQVIKGHTGKVLILAPNSAGEPLSVPQLRERISERMEGFERLSQRVVEPRLRLGRPAWIDAEDFDLDWHVAEPAHADPLSDEELRGAIGELLSERLDHARPLWRLGCRCRVVRTSGNEGGRFRRRRRCAAARPASRAPAPLALTAAR